MYGTARRAYRNVKYNRSSPPPPSTQLTRSSEPTKIVIDNSITKAFRRCLVHILPICTTIFILIINIKGVFVGSDFVGPIKSETINLLLLQLAAKVHELLIVASLGLIILQMVRHELLFGDGLPLGLVGSGLNFSNIGFFFQKEFYGALKYVARGNLVRKVLFLSVLLISGLTAALAGPTSAVLLVPKAQTWPSGGTPFFLNASPDKFWPDDLSSDLADVRRYCGPANSTNISICPGAGYSSLLQHWSRMNYSNFRQQDVRSYAQDLSGSRFYWPVYSVDSTIPPLYALGDYRKNDQPAANTFLVQPHAAVASVLQRITDDWWNTLVNDQKMDPRVIDDRQASSLFVSTPFTSVRCSLPQNISLNEQIIQMPSISGRFYYSRTSDFNMTRLDSTTKDRLRFRWVHLPDTFGAASIGGIFESPWVSGNQSRVVVGCTAQLGWIPTTLYTDKYTFWTGWYPWNLRFGDRTPAFRGAPSGQSLSPTDGRIALNDEWLELLTPPARPDRSINLDRQLTTIENILSNTGFDDIPPILNGTDLTTDWLNTDISGPNATPVKTGLLEAIIASVLVDGLSRTGAHRIFNASTDNPPSQWSLATYRPSPDFSTLLPQNRSAILPPPNTPPANLTTLRIDMSISGFSFRGSLSGWLSASVLLVHLLMALIHTTWIFFHRHSSWSWSSISELVALAQTSTPAVTVLKNCGAGVQQATTFARIAKIRVREASDGQSERVELVFEDEDEAHQTSKQGVIDAEVEMQQPQPQSSVVSIVPTTDMRRTSRLAGAATWHGESAESITATSHITASELSFGMSSIAAKTNTQSRSSSMEQLVLPRTYFVGNRSRAWSPSSRDIVRVNTAYG